ncbi:MAG TPA: adenylosuccinate synthase [Candidatus Caldiarchaeum subterraneum]|uniref:Adenylosuccinate synthetase n=1 Tax=Caldiarchaeum subterraneum TaxID=311458 RepID=A0A833EBM8_CALS0|nr:adenylosuccinate synthase [Candidatus Caldarchaeum subterraneum]
MTGIALIGLQWGDEGKGKVSAYFSREARLVVRFNGGANAGHTVKLLNRVYRLHIIPAGALTAGRAAVGPGVYVDLELLSRELEEVKEARNGFRLYLSPKAHVVLPIHKHLDGELEKKRPGSAIGTTRRGIGPAAMDKHARLGVRVEDLTMDEQLLKERIKQMIKIHNITWNNLDNIVEKLTSYTHALADTLDDVGLRIRREMEGGGKIVFEGAQGTLLDIDHGTYPYVTSSTTLASAAASGSGVGVKHINKVIGVAKAYATRVGSGPFPTEITGETAELIRGYGGEYGATTGRPRRIGWLDLPLLRYAANLNDAEKIVLTRIDTLECVEKIKVCVCYEVDGRRVEEAQVTSYELMKAQPIYVELGGWRGKVKNWSRVAEEGYGALPREARRYIEFIEEEVGVEISHVSTGPEVGDMVER